MRKYLVVAHRTMGGSVLMDHLHRLREADPYCRFHLVVPEQHPDRAWTEGEVQAAARLVLDEVLGRMAAMGMGATGEVGDANPVYAAGVALRREPFAGLVLSTLPRGQSAWWQRNVPGRMAQAFPHVPVTHIVGADEPIPA